MDVTEVTVIHHVGIVLMVIWFLSHFNCCHPVAYFISLIYLYLVHERYVMRLRKKLQFEERKQANQRRVLSDSETVRWLNHAVEKIWPICMEQIASQKVLLPIIPWFLEKYKPWTVGKAIVQHLYLGRNPPMFTEMRVLRQSTDDDHLVLELGMNFLTADDMLGILAVKLRKRLGFGIWTKLHITGMHVEGKVLIGVRFLCKWPFLGRVRLCFVEPPYFQMTVKPIFTHGLDVTEVPGIDGWLDKLLSVAFEQTLVQPNMLVVDMEKFTSPEQESWFSVDEKDPVAYVRVEVIEASDMKASDLNGFADPYVKGHLGVYQFKTKIQKKTLTPKWHEEFKIPIITWDSPNVLAIEVHDKDIFVDDTLGDCSINMGELRNGGRNDMWLPLQKAGRLHVAVTVLDENGKEQKNLQGLDLNRFHTQGDDSPDVQEKPDVEEQRNSFASDTGNKGSFSSISSGKKKHPNMAFVSQLTLNPLLLNPPRHRLTSKPCLLLARNSVGIAAAKSTNKFNLIVGARPSTRIRSANDDEREVESSGDVAVAVEEKPAEPEPAEISQLKKALVDSFYGTDRGLSATSETRAEIVELITQLEAKNPTPAPTEALPLLNGKWILAYTSFAGLFPLLSRGTLPLVKVEEISQTIDSENFTVQNSVQFAGPLATTSISTNATFEVRSPKRVQIKFEEGVIGTPQLTDSLVIPENVEFLGQKIELAPFKGVLNSVQDTASSVVKTISSRPPFKFSIPSSNAQSWLLTTYLDGELRISRGDNGSVFVLIKEGSPLLTS